MSTTSRKPRTPKRRCPSEHDEQVTLIDWFDLWAPPALRGRLAAVPNGGHRHAAVAGKLKAEGVRKGYLDLQLLIAMNGYHGLIIEMKRRIGGVTSRDQQGWLTWHREQGYKAEICHGCDAAMAVIAEYLHGYRAARALPAPPERMSYKALRRRSG